MPDGPETGLERVPGGWRARRLDPGRPYKPLDVGEAGVVASVDGWSGLVSVSQGHPRHGMVCLTATSPFADRDRYDPAAVRAYRWRLSTPGAAAFGFRPGGRATIGRTAWLIEDALPATGLGGRGPDRPAVVTFVPHPEEAGGARGVLQVLLPGAGGALPWGGRVRLARAAYTQLTEGGPLPPVEPQPTTAATETAVAMAAPELGWAVAIAGDLEPGAEAVVRSGGILVDVRLREGGRIVALGLGREGSEALQAARLLAGLDPGEALECQASRWRRRWDGWPAGAGPLNLPARRGLAYALGCCAIPVGGTVCLVTDHRILPLSWTRDAYYLARALLAWWATGGSAEGTGVVRRHLGWLFEVARRPDDRWARSHLVGGQPKDLAFQLDQQLYPLLELADYVDLTGDAEPLRRYRRDVERVLEALEARRAPAAALYATEENPADDPLSLPYHTAGNVLAWHTFLRLDRLGIGGGRLARLAAAVAEAVRRHQVVDDGEQGQMFAYATDLAGGALRYHDANDLPMAMAPAWGFCGPDDPVWRATMRFAFSPANPGFYPGPHGGLGSTHTPGAWPLGHAQARMAARDSGDHGDLEDAGRALAAAALWDGSLPEATDPGTGAPRSRPWFAWPGAALAADLLGAWGRL